MSSDPPTDQGQVCVCVSVCKGGHTGEVLMLKELTTGWYTHFVCVLWSVCEVTLLET